MPTNKKATTKITTPIEAKDPVRQRTLRGKVVSISGIKSVSVLVESIKMHPKYHKQYAVSTKYLVHDEMGTAVVGQLVTFVACRPLSARKHWRLVNNKK
jgi:small subunit ribosomal protein S17